MNANTLANSNHKESIKTISERDEEDCDEDETFRRGTVKSKVEGEEYPAGRATVRSNNLQSNEFKSRDDLL